MPISEGAGAMVSGGLQAVGTYLAARESRKAEEMKIAIQMAMEQRQQQLNAAQNTNREYDAAIQNMMGATKDSLRY